MGFDAAYWYLTSEVVFYALLPLLVLKIRGLRQRLALFGVLLAVTAAIDIWMMYVDADALVSGYTFFYLYFFPLTHLWIFVAGVLLRMLVEHLDEKRPGGSWPTLAFSLFVGSLVFLALLPYIPLLGDLLTSDRFIIDLTSLTSLAAIPFFAAALLGSPVLSRILSWRRLIPLGM